MAAPSRPVGPRPIAREARDRARKRSRPIRVTVVPARVWKRRKIPSTVACAVGGRPSCRRVSEGTFTHNDRNGLTNSTDRCSTIPLNQAHASLRSRANSLHDRGPERLGRPSCQARARETSRSIPMGAASVMVGVKATLA
jgi:hypothetical protein